MKNKLLSILTILTLNCLCLFGFTACEENEPPHTHSFTNYISDNNATYEADGTKTAKCDSCDATNTIIDEGSKLIPTDASAFVFDNGTITGLTDYGKTLTEIIIPNSINGVNVASIGNSAFYESTSLTSVTIGNGITSIGDYAFYRCMSLTSIVMPNSITSIGIGAFAGCSFASIVIPNSVTSIGSGVFYYCTSLTSIVIPKSVTSIGEDAFYGCYTLVEVINKSPYITVEKGSEYNGNLGYYALSVSNCDDSYVSKLSTDSNGYVIYTDGSDKILVNYVGKQTKLTLPNDITKINGSAFYYCDSLTSVTIGNGVTSIGKNAFSGCESLTSIVIPDGVTSIGDYAFSYCTSLTSVVIPNSVTSIGNYLFSDCNSLNYNVKDNLKYLGNSSNPYLYLAGTTSDSITTATIDSNCKFIGEYVFAFFNSLTSVVIPNSVTSIGDCAFFCDSLTSVTIGNGVTSIGDSAFRGCYSLTSIKYRGSQSQWSAIDKGSDWDDDTGNYTITYNYNDN